MNTCKSSMLKKSIVSFGVLSLLTAGLIELEEYQTKNEELSFSEQLSRYIIPAKVGDEIMYFKQASDLSILTTDVNQLASIAEANLFVKPSNDKALNLSPTSLTSMITVDDSLIERAKKERDQSVVADVYFELSSFELQPQYKLQLLDVAKKIKAEDKSKHWQIVGHTDKSGSATYNLKLAKQRANKVVDFLVSQGVQNKQLKVLTLGEYEAMHLANSTYNSGLRKVQVMQSKPRLEKLALKVQQENVEIERRLLANKKAKAAALLTQQRAEQQNILDQEDIVQEQLLLAEQQQIQNQLAAIKAENNLPETVQVNTDLQLTELEMIENEEQIWLTEQIIKADRLAGSESSNSTETEYEVDEFENKPTAMLTPTSYTF